jgi:hypothetical protein
MSFGDPNNPYGQPPQQPPGQGYPSPPPNQPGYGYPQAPQPPQGPAGYGYPGQPPQYPGYPGGNMMPMEMPGLMKTARVLLFILAGLQILAGLIVGITIGALQDTSNAFGSGGDTGTTSAIGILIALLLLVLGALSIFLGVRFKTGAGGIRVTTIVYASFMILGGIVNLANGNNGSGTFGGIISLAVSGIILASMVNSQASAWFNRPRY